MSPKVGSPTVWQQTWMKSHRCVICDGLPSTVNSEMIVEHRQLRDEFMYLARHGLPAEPWQTEHVGGTHRVVVTCENGHTFVATYTRFKEAT